MKPADLLDPETLPEDLRWLVADFKLAPKDPVFLLIAWHWHRVNNAEDSLRAANIELQTAVDSRIKTIASAAESVSSLNQSLTQLRADLESKPGLLAAQLDAGLKAPLAKLHALNQSLGALLRSTQEAIGRSRRTEILAALLAGVALGVLGSVILLLA